MDALLMEYFVAVTDSPAGNDLSIEREVLAGNRVEKLQWLDAADLRHQLRKCDGVLCMHAPLSRSVMGAMECCRAIVRYGTGLDNIDVDAAAGFGIAVAGIRDYCVEEVANHTIALLLAWNRRLFEYQNMVRKGMWNSRQATTGNWGYRLERLSDRTLGLLGFGHIGRAVAERARALGMLVLAHSPSLKVSEASGFGVRSVERDVLFAESDFLSLHLPLDSTTRQIINGEVFGTMKPGAVLINTSRGGLVDEMALVEALQSGRLAGALLDVYQCAPLPLDHPLRKCDNTILTPHVAFYSEGTLAELRRRAADELRRRLASNE
jgi:D-3-phosphoglycerate dehydrogenase